MSTLYALAACAILVVAMIHGDNGESLQMVTCGILFLILAKLWDKKE